MPEGYFGQYVTIAIFAAAGAVLVAGALGGVAAKPAEPGGSAGLFLFG